MRVPRYKLDVMQRDVHIRGMMAIDVQVEPLSEQVDVPGGIVIIRGCDVEV